jgi:hypothetical protein
MTIIGTEIYNSVVTNRGTANDPQNNVILTIENPYKYSLDTDPQTQANINMLILEEYNAPVILFDKNVK